MRLADRSADADKLPLGVPQLGAQRPIVPDDRISRERAVENERRRRDAAEADPRRVAGVLDRADHRQIKGRDPRPTRLHHPHPTGRERSSVAEKESPRTFLDELPERARVGQRRQARNQLGLREDRPHRRGGDRSRPAWEGSRAQELHDRLLERFHVRHLGLGGPEQLSPLESDDAHAIMRDPQSDDGAH